MELYRYSDRIWYSSYEEERDRPVLGYIRGDRFSIAVDAGHSDVQVKEFYDLLRKNGLPLPMLTVITHWHWDHSFGMHAVNGLTVSNQRTNAYLKDFIQKRSPENDQAFLALDPSIAKEYEGGKEIVVIPADIAYENRMVFDAGGLRVELFEAVSPHTDDATLIHIPSERTVFYGDAMSGVFPTWIPDLELLKQFRDTIASIDADTFIGGHWEPFTKEELLRELQNSLDTYTKGT